MSLPVDGAGSGGSEIENKKLIFDKLNLKRRFFFEFVQLKFFFKLFHKIKTNHLNQMIKYHLQMVHH